MAPDYQELETALDRAGSEYRPAESHGLLCGAITVNSKASIAQCLAEILFDCEAGDVLAKEAWRLLASLAESTREQLGSDDAEFELLLPADDAALSARADAMVKWCEGFLFGMSLGGLTSGMELPQDSAEIISDITSIANADSADPEDDEFALQEIIEYLRVSVMILSEEVEITSGHGPH